MVAGDALQRLASPVDVAVGGVAPAGHAIIVPLAAAVGVVDRHCRGCARGVIEPARPGRELAGLIVERIDPQGRAAVVDLELDAPVHLGEHAPVAGDDVLHRRDREHRQHMPVRQRDVRDPTRLGQDAELRRQGRGVHRHRRRGGRGPDCGRTARAELHHQRHVRQRQGDGRDVAVGGDRRRAVHRAVDVNVRLNGAEADRHLLRGHEPGRAGRVVPERRVAPKHEVGRTRRLGQA